MTMSGVYSTRSEIKISAPLRHAVAFITEAELELGWIDAVTRVQVT